MNAPNQPFAALAFRGWQLLFGGMLAWIILFACAQVIGTFIAQGLTRQPLSELVGDIALNPTEVNALRWANAVNQVVAFLGAALITGVLSWNWRYTLSWGKRPSGKLIGLGALFVLGALPVTQWVSI